MEKLFLSPESLKGEEPKTNWNFLACIENRFDIWLRLVLGWCQRKENTWRPNYSWATLEELPFKIFLWCHCPERDHIGHSTKNPLRFFTEASRNLGTVPLGRLREGLHFVPCTLDFIPLWWGEGGHQVISVKTTFCPMYFVFCRLYPSSPSPATTACLAPSLLPVISPAHS